MIVSGIPFVAGRNDYADRDGTKYGIAIHNTSNTASASAEASYATRRTDGTSSHFYADGTGVIQSIDTKYRAGHAGSYEGNEHAVAVEITGTNDKSRAWWIANVAWDKLGQVLAQVCHTYGIEPRRASVAEMQRNPKVRAFYSHDDMRRAWGGTTHTDPGPNFPWDYLFAAVKAALTPEDDMSAQAESEIHQVYAGMFNGGSSMGRTVDPDGSGARTPGNSLVAKLDYLMLRVDQLAAQVTALSGKDFTDEQAIVTGVLAGLPAEKIAAALPPELAQQLADELTRRLAS